MLLLLLVAGGAPHLGHQAGVPHPDRAPVPEVLGVDLLVQGEVAGHDGVGAPGPGQSPAYLGVVALAGLDERRGLPGAEGGAGPGDGGEGSHPPPSHRQGEAGRLLQGKTVTQWTGERGPGLCDFRLHSFRQQAMRRLV